MSLEEMTFEEAVDLLWPRCKHSIIEGQCYSILNRYGGKVFEGGHLNLCATAMRRVAAETILAALTLGGSQ